MSSVFPNAINYFVFENLPDRVIYFRMEHHGISIT